MLRMTALLAAALAVSASASAPPGSIAYVTKKGGQDTIMLIAGGAESEIARSRLVLLTRHSWSPDGMRLAFGGFGQDDEAMATEYRLPMHFPLYVVNADGSGMKRVLDFPVEPSFKWSPDGRRIAFTSAHEDPDRQKPEVMRGVQAVKSSLYVVELATGRVVKLPSQGRTHSMSWSPDGRSIAFQGESEPGNTDVFVLDADGTAPRRLTTAPTNDVQPDWSPDGKSIAYVAAPRPSAAGSEGGVYVVNVDGTGPRRVYERPVANVSWSPSGTHLMTGSSPVAVIDAATGAFTEPLPQGSLDPMFTPDGTKILYRLAPAGVRPPVWTLYERDLNGASERQIATPMTLFSVARGGRR